jgi:hypothetical protein
VRGRYLFALVGCGVLLLALSGIGLHLQRHDEIAGFVAVALAQAGVYLLALRISLRAAARQTVAVILGFAIALRLMLVFAPPYLSSDIYRYLWDGRVIAAGINPYRYIPTDPHLAALRDPAIFPNINRGNYARTIYPPAAEAVFFLVTRVAESVTAMKLAMIGFEAVAVALLIALLVGSGQPASRIIIYAWHPLPLWEFAGSGHVDALIVASVALALWSRRRALPWLTGLALAGATLVKFYPAAIFPALWQRWDWRMPAVFAAALVLAYLPFLAVGSGVLGFLPHYLVEEGFTAGGGGFYLPNVIKSLLPLGGVADIVYVVGTAVLLAGLALFVALRLRPADGDVGAAALLAGAVMLLLSPHYPWYFTWLIVFACLVPSVALAWLTLASFLLYLVPVGSQLIWDRPRFIVESVLYMPFLLLAAIDLRHQRRREQPKHVDYACR